MSERYKYYFTPGPKVICVSTYAGKYVRGVAVCSDVDEFDVEKGKMLAKARCDLKIAEKRYNRAESKLSEAYEAREAADIHYERMLDYSDDAADALWEAKETLAEVLRSM